MRHPYAGGIIAQRRHVRRPVRCSTQVPASRTLETLLHQIHLGVVKRRKETSDAGIVNIDTKVGTEGRFPSGGGLHPANFNIRSKEFLYFVAIVVVRFVQQLHEKIDDSIHCCTNIKETYTDRKVVMLEPCVATQLSRRQR